MSYIEKAFTAPIQKRQKTAKVLFISSATVTGLIGLGIIITAFWTRYYLKMQANFTGALEMYGFGILLIFFATISILAMAAHVISFKWYVPVAVMLSGLSIGLSIWDFIAARDANLFPSDLESGAKTSLTIPMKYHLLEYAETSGCLVDKDQQISCSDKLADNYFRMLTCDGKVLLSMQCYSIQKEAHFQSNRAVILCTAAQKLAERLSNLLILAGSSGLMAGIFIAAHTGFAVWLNFRTARKGSNVIPK